MTVLLISFDSNPLFREGTDKNNVKPKNIIDYYEELISLIDINLPNQEKYQVMNSSAFYRTLTEIEGLKKLTEKLSEVFTATVLVEESVRAHIWKELYSYLDYLVYRTYEVQQEAERGYQVEKDWNMLQLQEEISELSPWLKTSGGEHYTQAAQQIVLEGLIKDASLTRNRVLQVRTHSLDGFLAEMVKDRMKVYGVNGSIVSKDESATYVQQLVDQQKKLLDEASPSIRRITGYHPLELLEMKLKNLQDEIEQHVVTIRSEFDKMPTMEDEIIEILDKIEQIQSNPPVIDDVPSSKQDEATFPFGFLRNFKKGTLLLHDEMAQVIARLEDDETHQGQGKKFYERVLKFSEDVLTLFEQLENPKGLSLEKEKEYYEGFLTFINQIIANKDQYEPYVQSVTAQAALLSLESTNQKEKQK